MSAVLHLEVLPSRLARQIPHGIKTLDHGRVVDADAHTLLTKIPSVRGLKIGRPAKKFTPNFAKNDYDVGLLVLFDDFAGLKTYLEHPLHLKYVAKHKDKFDKVLVYDFNNQKN